MMRTALHFFPPEPKGLRGRADELRTLARAIEPPARLALVGAGGSGKSMLAAALGHAMRERFGGRLHWFRVGTWDVMTLAKMMALRFGVGGPDSRGAARSRRGTLAAVRRFLDDHGPRFVVLDNHENDVAMAELLDGLRGTKSTFVLTARRCLLAGLLVYPVTAPLVTQGKSAFPRVSALTRMLRWNPLALDIADALVSSGATTVGTLAEHLEAQGITRVRAIEHEDDLPEVAALVGLGWSRIGSTSRRILGVLALSEGDHMDVEALAVLAKVGRVGTTEAAIRALEPLRRFHLVQEPLPGRFALHAVVRHAVLRRTKLLAADVGSRALEHFVRVLERDPSRLAEEETHFFAAMDFAQRQGDMGSILRLDELSRLVEGDAS